jgi:ABC-type lipoprotein export system ATPase subunit
LKGLERLDVQLGDFNVIVGPNNCGKSTVLQAIDLCFRFMQYHAEFKRGLLVPPRAGKQVPPEMLPVAEARDFWFGRKIRAANKRVPVRLGIRLKGEVEFEFEIRHMWGGVNSRMVKLPEQLPEDTMRAILARRPVLIPASVGVVSREEWRTPPRLELLSVTGHHNEVLRNYLLRLADEKPELFESLRRDLTAHLGGTIGALEFSRETDQYIEVHYEERGNAHDIFSAGGGFLQLLQILTYLYLQAPGIALLDEPDAHLHSGLQSLVVDLLQDVATRQGLQVVLATHSKEIINYVDPTHIIPLSRHASHARSLERQAGIFHILEDLGAVDNVDLTAMVANRKCVFVEGRDDKRLLTRFATALGSTCLEGDSRVVIIRAEGVDHPEKYVGLDIFEATVGQPIEALIIRDRDALPQDLVQEMREQADKQGRRLWVLGKTHLENYLLVPSAIWRVVRDELRRRDRPEADTLAEEDVAVLVDEAVSTLQESTFDYIGVQIGQHWVAYHKRHLEHNTINDRARQYLGAEWESLEGRLAVVKGDEALAAVRRAVQERWAVSFSKSRLVDAMTAAEIDQEIKDIISAIESL